MANHSSRFWARSPRTPGRVATAIVQLVVLAVATAILATVLAAGSPDRSIPAPAHLDTTERTAEPMGHGGIR